MIILRICLIPVFLTLAGCIATVAGVGTALVLVGEKAQDVGKALNGTR